jgi:hypothetical protein
LVGGVEAAECLVERALVAADGEQEFAAPGLEFALRGTVRRLGRERVEFGLEPGEFAA